MGYAARANGSADRARRCHYRKPQDEPGGFTTRRREPEIRKLTESGVNRVGATGGGGDVVVNAKYDQAWTAASDCDWVVVLDGATGRGKGKVTYAIAPNTGDERTGRLTIAEHSVTIVQSAAIGAKPKFSITKLDDHAPPID